MILCVLLSRGSKNPEVEILMLEWNSLKNAAAILKHIIGSFASQNWNKYSTTRDLTQSLWSFYLQTGIEIIPLKHFPSNCQLFFPQWNLSRGSAKSFPKIPVSQIYPKPNALRTPYSKRLGKLLKSPRTTSLKRTVKTMLNALDKNTCSS